MAQIQGRVRASGHGHRELGALGESLSRRQRALVPLTTLLGPSGKAPGPLSPAPCSWNAVPIGPGSLSSWKWEGMLLEGGRVLGTRQRWDSWSPETTETCAGRLFPEPGILELAICRPRKWGKTPCEAGALVVATDSLAPLGEWLRLSGYQLPHL